MQQRLLTIGVCLAAVCAVGIWAEKSSDAAGQAEEQTVAKKSRMHNMRLNMLNRHSRTQLDEEEPKNEDKRELRSPFARGRYHMKGKRSANDEEVKGEDKRALRSPFARGRYHMKGKRSADEEEVKGEDKRALRSPFARGRYHMKGKRSAAAADYDDDDGEWLMRKMATSSYLMGKRDGSNLQDMMRHRLRARYGYGKRAELDRIRWLKMQRFGRSPRMPPPPLPTDGERQHMLKMWGKRDALYNMDNNDQYLQSIMNGDSPLGNYRSYYKRGQPPSAYYSMLRQQAQLGKRWLPRQPLQEFGYGKRDAADYDLDDMLAAEESKRQGAWSPMGKK